MKDMQKTVPNEFFFYLVVAPVVAFLGYMVYLFISSFWHKQREKRGTNQTGTNANMTIFPD